MNSNLELIVLEYSHTQEAFHVETMAELIKTNLIALKGGNSHDYHIVWIFSSWEEYDRDWPKAKEKVLKWVNKRQITDAA